MIEFFSGLVIGIAIGLGLLVWAIKIVNGGAVWK